MIAPLLAALGAPDAPFSWPNYASRLGFELWSLSGPKALAAARGGDYTLTEGGGGGGGGEPGEGWVEPLVKVLYNGVNWTPQLACAARGQGESPAAACTLTAFLDQISALIAPHTSWEAACFTTEPHVKHGDGHSHPTKAGVVASDVGVGFGAAAAEEEEDSVSEEDVGPGRAVDSLSAAPEGE